MTLPPSAARAPIAFPAGGRSLPSRRQEGAAGALFKAGVCAPHRPLWPPGGGGGETRGGGSAGTLLHPPTCGRLLCHCFPPKMARTAAVAWEKGVCTRGARASKGKSWRVPPPRPAPTGRPSGGGFWTLAFSPGALILTSPWRPMCSIPPSRTTPLARSRPRIWGKAYRRTILPPEAAALFALRPVLEEKLQAQNMWKLYQEIEHPLCAVPLRHGADRRGGGSHGAHGLGSMLSERIEAAQNHGLRPGRRGIQHQFHQEAGGDPL